MILTRFWKWFLRQKLISLGCQSWCLVPVADANMFMVLVMFMLIWCWHVQAVDMILIVRSMLRGISCQPVGRFLWFSDTTERGAKIEREALAKNETPDWFSFTAYIEISKYVRIWKNNAMEKKTSQKLRNCPNSRYSKYSRYSRIVKFVWNYEIGRNCEIWTKLWPKLCSSNAFVIFIVFAFLVIFLLVRLCFLITLIKG